MKIVLATGGFDPIHTGHLSYLNAAKALGDILIVGVNTDAWLERKKGQAFMPRSERAAIVQNLAMVDHVTFFDDSDGTAIEAIRTVKGLYPNDEIIFANGGDRTATNIPEMAEQNVIFKFGVGGDNKANSSSWILEEWKAPKTERPWGYYRVLHELNGMKVKELTVNPGQSLSMQKHTSRNEYWIVSEGACILQGLLPLGYAMPPFKMEKHVSQVIKKGEWHQLTNPYAIPCRIVEIQYGDVCIEEDIERK
jgi:cytidyltransferase-like protein